MYLHYNLVKHVFNGKNFLNDQSSAGKDEIDIFTPSLQTCMITTFSGICMSIIQLNYLLGITELVPW